MIRSWQEEWKLALKPMSALGVMTNNLNSGGIEIGGAKIGENCFIGTNAVLQHGITVGNNVIIGALSFVHKDCEAESTYVGIPAKKIK